MGRGGWAHAVEYFCGDSSRGNDESESSRSKSTGKWDPLYSICADPILKNTDRTQNPIGPVDCKAQGQILTFKSKYDNFYEKKILKMLNLDLFYYNMQIVNVLELFIAK